MAKKISPIVQSAIDAKLSADDASYILNQASLLEKSRRDFFGMLSIAVKRFGTQDSSIATAGNKLFAFTERLRCLKELLDNTKINAWTRETGLDDDSILIHPAIIYALVYCPLSYDSNTDKLYFEEGVFLEIVLRNSEVAGRA